MFPAETFRDTRARLAAILDRLGIRYHLTGELDRSVAAEIFAGLSLPIASRADAALSKLVSVSKGSHKSRRDLRQILRPATASDLEFVDRRAAERGLAALLREVLAESDTIEP